MDLEYAELAKLLQLELWVLLCHLKMDEFLRDLWRS